MHILFLILTDSARCEYNTYNGTRRASVTLLGSMRNMASILFFGKGLNRNTDLANLEQFSFPNEWEQILIDSENKKAF